MPTENVYLNRLSHKRFQLIIENLSSGVVHTKLLGAKVVNHLSQCISQKLQ